MTLMGVGAQNDLGGHQSFARRMTWKLLDKSIVFSVQIEVISKKKRPSLKLRRYFCPNCGNLKKKKKKKVFTHIWKIISVQIEVTSKKKKVFTHIETVILSSAQNILLGKLAQTTWNCPKFWRKIAQKIWNRPKFWCKIAQNIWNCP